MKDRIHSYLKSNALWTFLDQSIVSGASLILSILLVAYLGIDGFGVYSLYWMAIMLISGFHQALIVMPLYTLYAKMDDLEIYIGKLLIEQLLFSVVSFILVVFIFVLLNLIGFQIDLFHGVILGLIVATVTFQDLLRRILFVKSRPIQVLIVDVISVGLLPIVFIVMWNFYSIDLSSVLVVILVLKVLSILVAMYFVNPKKSLKRRSGDVRKAHWESGKYLLASSVLQWFSGNAFVLVSGMLLGPASIGVLRIAQSILGVVNVFFLFLENRIPIKAAKILHENGEVVFNKYMMTESKRYLLLLLASLLSLALFHEPITRFFYGEAMKDFQWLIPAYCALYLLIYAGTMLRFTFRTLDQNKVIFYGYVISAIVGLCTVYPMINWWGVPGAIIGLFATQIATIITYSFYLNKNHDII